MHYAKKIYHNKKKKYINIYLHTQLAWVCEEAYLGSAAQSAFFVGSIVGGLIFGYIADHHGRLPALVACNAVGFFASIVTAFTNSFWTFAAARFVVGSSFDNCFNIIFIIGNYNKQFFFSLPLFYLLYCK